MDGSGTKWLINENNDLLILAGMRKMKGGSESLSPGEGKVADFLGGSKSDTLS